MDVENSDADAVVEPENTSLAKPAADAAAGKSPIATVESCGAIVDRKGEIAALPTLGAALGDASPVKEEVTLQLVALLCSGVAAATAVTEKDKGDACAGEGC